MPTISIINGIKVNMYYSEHNPPHFHAYYGESKVIISIKSMRVLEGTFPKTQLKEIKKWAKQHKNDLLLNWELMLVGKKLKQISPYMKGD